MTKKEKEFTKEFLAEVIKIRDSKEPFNEKKELEHYRDVILRERLRFIIQLEGQKRLITNNPVFQQGVLEARIQQIDSESNIIEEKLKNNN